LAGSNADGIVFGVRTAVRQVNVVASRGIGQAAIEAQI
jgi:hypothetical protein